MAIIAESVHRLHEIGSAPETMNGHKKNQKPSGRDTIDSGDKSMAPQWNCKSNLWGTPGQKPIPIPKECLMTVVNLLNRNRVYQNNVPGV